MEDTSLSTLLFDYIEQKRKEEKGTASICMKKALK